MKKILFNLIFIISFVLCLIGCDDINKGKTLKSIEFESIGKEQYYLGEEFDVNGYVLKVTYEDDTESLVNLTNEMVTVDMTQEGNVILYINYLENGNNKEITHDISIIKKKNVVSIEVKTEGKKHYHSEVELDLSGYIFTITYDDNTTSDVVLTKEHASITTFELNKGEPIDVSIDISYTLHDKTVQTTIIVYNLYSWDYEDYYLGLEDEAMFEEIYNHQSEYIDSVIANDVVSIQLLSSTDYNYKYILKWGSSDPYRISTTGDVRPNDDDTEVILSLQIEGLIKTVTYTWTITVKGLGRVELKPFDKTQKNVFAYFYEGTYINLTSANASKIDVLNYCFVTINSNGSLNLGGLRNFETILKWRRDYKLRIVLSLGGGGSSANFGAVCIDPVKRKVLVDDCMRVLKEYKVDGYDIDWEYPQGKAEKDGLSSFIKELREKMDQYRDDLLFTAAVIAGTGTGDILEKFDVPVMNTYLDYVHLMTYDLNSSGVATHHSNPYKDMHGRLYSAENSIAIYHKAGLDYNKIIIGVGFYGKIGDLEVPQEANSNVYMKTLTNIKSIKYHDIIIKYLNKNGFIRLWDDKGKAPYLTDGKQFITYEDGESIYWKANLINSYQLGGAMFWDYGSDDTGYLLNELFNNIYDINKGTFK